MQMQAKYTDCMVLNKHELVSERDLDEVIDHLYTLNDETPMIRVGKENPLDPDVIFGLDTKLFIKHGEETAEWERDHGNTSKSQHSDEVETKTIWKGGRRPGSKGKGKQQEHDHAACADDCHPEEDSNPKGDDGASMEIVPVGRETLEAQLGKLPFEIYRGQWPSSMRSACQADLDLQSKASCASKPRLGSLRPIF